MKNKDEIISIAQNTIRLEADCLMQLVEYVDEHFFEAVNHISKSQGRVVITGIGKSAIIAQKIVSTLNSTGTPSIFMHAADAIHGDLGIIQDNDTIICISKSGNTPEIKLLIPLLKRDTNILISICGNSESFLAKHCNYYLNTFVEKEACPNNLAPTTSTTAQLAMGDALAVALLEMRNFSKEDFAKFHPGGTLGKQLYLKVKDISIHNQIPIVSLNSTLKEVLFEISSKRLGATAVLENNEIRGVITDGDIRRMLEKFNVLAEVTAQDMMNMFPKTIESEALAVEALLLMRENNVSQLLVTLDGKYSGFVHIQDLMKEGIV